jgi:hypothetical protein
LMCSYCRSRLGLDPLGISATSRYPNGLRSRAWSAGHYPVCGPPFTQVAPSPWDSVPVVGVGQGRQGSKRLMRDRLYFILMAVCLAMFVLAWAVVRLYSVIAAVVMTVVAMAIPPVAVIIANAGDEATRRRRR